MIIIIKNIDRQHIKHLFLENNQLEIEYLSGLKYYFPSISKSLVFPLFIELDKAVKLNKIQKIDFFLIKILKLIQDEPYSIKNSIIKK